MTKTLEFDQSVVDQLVKLRDDEDKKWQEISDITGIPVGKAMFIHSVSKVSKKDRVKDATPADVKRLRDTDKLSWGDIMVRCSLPEGAVRKLYREAGGEDKGNRIGRGGRYPGGTDRPEGSAKPKREPKSKAAPAHDVFEGLDDVAIKAKVEGYAIKVDLGGGETETIGVKTVKKVDVEKGRIVLVDLETGAGRTLKLATISAVSKKKVSKSA